MGPVLFMGLSSRVQVPQGDDLAQPNPSSIDRITESSSNLYLDPLA